MKINIVGGSGVMGAIHGQVFKDAGHEVIISGRRTNPGIEEAARQSDLTIISVPIEVTEEIIKKVAPYCNAIVDFTSLKAMPVKAMLKYSQKKCEVMGLHPLYGAVSTINGETVIVCETERTGALCKELLKAFEKAGAKLKKMKAEKHDFIVTGILQNARLNILESFALLLDDSGMTIDELYEISPPPTRALIDLIARQSDKKNDSLYDNIKKYDNDYEKIKEKLIEILSKDKNGSEHKRVRAGFKNIKKFQDKAKGMLDSEKDI